MRIPRSLCALALATLLVPGVAAAGSKTVLDLRFDKEKGDKAKDSSDEKNNGTIRGATYTNDVPALPGGSRNRKALFFDAKNDYVTIPAGPGTLLNEFPKGLTVEAYIKPSTIPIPVDGIGGRLQYILWGDDDVISMALVGNEDDETFLSVGVNNVNGAPGPCTASIRVPFTNTETFTHVAMVYQDELLQLFLDGVEVASRAAPAGCGSSVGPLGFRSVIQVGSDETAGGGPQADRDFRGVIDQVKISRRALSPEDLVPNEPVQACPESPAEGCFFPAVGGASKLTIDPGKDKLKWVLKQTKVKLGKVGLPRLDTDYYMCLYDQSGPVERLVSGVALPAGKDWKVDVKGREITFKSDGDIKSVTLDLGSADDAKIKLVGRGGALPSLPLNQDAYVIFQLVGSQGNCWEDRYGAPAESNDTTLFKDRGGD